jgi:hypothetical protein
MKVSLKNHLSIALFIGLVFRILSLWFVWGPQGLDDYLDNLIPAWRHSIGLEPDLHDYRSPLYMWILSSWLKVGSLFGISNAISQIRWVYFFQGSVSLLAIIGVYLIAKRSKNQMVPIISMYLVSMHGLMPFASTRSFMESFAMGLLTLAIALLATAEEERQRPFRFIVFGFVILGFTSLVRFQVGIIYVSWLLLMLYCRNLRQFWFGFLFGFFLIFAEGLIDKIYGRELFGTLKAYFAFNSDQEKSGIMPWYNTWATWLGAVYFPISLLIWKGWKKAFSEYWKVFVPVFLYVLIHSLNPHKEERYLYPIIPLSFIFFASAWSAAMSTKAVRWVFHPLFAIFNTLILFIGCFVNTQVGLVGPLAEVQKQTDRALYLDYDKIDMRDFMAPFFVRAPAKKITMEGAPSADHAKKIFSENEQLEDLVLIDSHTGSSATMALVRQELSRDLNCHPVETATSLSDKILYQLRPDRNQRRKPTFYFRCSR